MKGTCVATDVRGQADNMTGVRGGAWPWIAVIVVIGLVIGLQTLFTYFACDDFYWLNAAKRWTDGDAPLFAPNCANNFRPGTHLIVYATYLAFGDRAIGYHVVSVLLHIIVAVGIFSMVSRFVEDRRPAMLASVFFVTASGPMESFQWVSGMPMLVVGIMFVVAMISADKYAANGSPLFLGFASTASLAALFTHEFAILIPVVSSLYAFVSGRVSGSRIRSIVLCNVAILAVWFMAYHNHYAGRSQSIGEVGEPRLISLSSIPSNMRVALPSLLMPNVSAPSVQQRLPEGLPWVATVFQVFWVGALVLVSGFILYGLVNRAWQSRLGALWCAAGLCIASIAASGIAGRYLYLAIMGFVLVLATTYAALLQCGQRKWARFFLAVCSLLIAVNMACTQVTLSFLGVSAQGRIRLLTQIRQIAARHPEVTDFAVVDLPDKYSRGISWGAGYYGVKVTTSVPESANTRTMVLVYRDGDLVMGNSR